MHCDQLFCRTKHQQVGGLRGAWQPLLERGAHSTAFPAPPAQRVLSGTTLHQCVLGPPGTGVCVWLGVPHLCSSHGSDSAVSPVVMRVPEGVETASPGLFVMGGHRDRHLLQEIALLLGSACPRHHLRKLPRIHMKSSPCVPAPLGETKLLSPCMAALSAVFLLCGVVPTGRAGADPALGPGALGPRPGSKVGQGCRSLAAGEAVTGTKECSCCSNKEQ